MKFLCFGDRFKTIKVKFIMIGGFATNLHGYQRFTGDMDIWIKDTKQNRKNLRKAFAEYGLGDIELLEKINFVPGCADFYLNNGLRLDIITDMKGLDDYSFDECYNVSAIAEIENVQIPFLHISHLILNKKSIGREKDHLDVKYLEKIKKLREEEMK